MHRFGAPPEAWDHLVDLKLTADLLPVVSNPHAEISPNSTMKSKGKTPSVYNRDRQVAGLPQWTKVEATELNVQRWKAEPDYGICLQARKVRAFDIDVPDPEIAKEIAAAIQQITGALPLRHRTDSGKRLLAFTYNRPLTKRVVPVEGGMVEILADGQQFIFAGTHPDGAAYGWQDGLPKAFPVLTQEQFDKVWQLLVLDYATDQPRVAREKRAGAGTSEFVGDDPVAKWLLENWETYDVGNDGQLFIECPFADEHTSDSGPSSTAYFSAGTGGYSQGHFVCLHAHCNGREDRDFLDRSGYSLAQFTDLTVIDRPRDPAPARPLTLRTSSDPVGSALDSPPMLRDKSGRIEPTAENMREAIRHGGMIGRHIAYDGFTDNLMWARYDEPIDNAQWQRLTDAEVTDIRIELERRGFKAMGKELLRECLHNAAHKNAIDSAAEWLGRLRWDGVPRIERFAIDCWGWADSDYSRAVGLYLWTALAGRTIEPGVRADMAPILVGAQGIKKTSAIQAMVPYEDAYAEIKLDERDDDMSRKLRGKQVGELEELRGLQSREINEIKAFVSRRRENWVPKFKEFENHFWRRCILIGSTNDDQFLADPTGERRWLPGVCVNGIDVAKIKADRDQLWAEGAMRFIMEGVLWQDAERLAEREHPRFKITDSWEKAILNWLDAEEIGGTKPLDRGPVTTGDVLAAALGIPVGQQQRHHEQRAARALRHLGLKMVTEGGRQGFTR